MARQNVLAVSLTCNAVVVEPQHLEGLEAADAVWQLVEAVRGDMKRRKRSARTQPSPGGAP